MGVKDSVQNGGTDGGMSDDHCMDLSVRTWYAVHPVCCDNVVLAPHRGRRDIGQIPVQGDEVRIH